MLQNFYNTFAVTKEVDFAFWFIASVVIFFTVFNGGLTLYFLWRYSEKKNPKPRVDLHGNMPLEVFWTIVPTILVFLFFWYGYTSFAGMRDFPDDALHVKVTGRMWSFSYEYENGEVFTELFVPAGKPVLLEMVSVDVIHSHFIPAFRQKQDLIPGLTTYQWFNAEKEGDYDILCAEYCGLRHANMLSKVRAVSEDQFKAIVYQGADPEEVLTGKVDVAALAAAPIEKPALASADAGAPAVDTAALAKKGAKLVQAKACTSCHSQDGSKIVGPSFKGLWGSTHQATREGNTYDVTVNEEYVTRAIMDPAYEIVAGYPPAMTKQNVSDQELKAIIEYLKTLK